MAGWVPIADVRCGLRVLCSIIVPSDRRRGIEETAIHTDYSLAVRASPVPPEYQRRTTRACPLPSTLSFIRHKVQYPPIPKSVYPRNPHPSPKVQTPIHPTTPQCTPIRASAPSEMPLTHQSLETPDLALVINSTMHLKLHQSTPSFGISLLLAVARTTYGI